MNGEDISKIIEYEKSLMTPKKQTPKKSKKHKQIACPKSLKKIKKNYEIYESYEEEKDEEEFIKGSDESSSIAV